MEASSLEVLEVEGEVEWGWSYWSKQLRTTAT